MNQTLKVNVKQQTCFEYVYVACRSSEGAKTGIFYTKCSTLVGYKKNQKKSFGRIYLSFGRVRYRENIIRKILKKNTGGVAVKNKSED